MADTVLITGGAGGIGAATARLFYENGYNVAINYNKSEEEAKELEAELKGSFAVKCDITDEKEVSLMVSSVIERYGKIDVLVNNAGVAMQKLITDVTEAEWNNLFDINVKGTFLTSKHVLRNMICRHSGKIVNISSMWGICGASCEACYSASKGAVIAFTKALAKEVGPSGITVNCVAPGFTDTKMNKNISIDDANAFCEDTPLGKMGTPREVAEAVFFLASDKASFITGQILAADGGASV